MSQATNNANLRTEKINYDTLENALQTKALLRNFEPTGGDVVEYVEMTWDDNRMRSIRGDTETNTWTVSTTIYGDTNREEFDTVESAVSFIASNYIHDMGRGVVESLELNTAEDALIDDDTVRGLLTRVSNVRSKRQCCKSCKLHFRN